MNNDIIAWLVPTTRGSSADKATTLSANTPHTISPSSSKYLSSQLSDLSTKPQRAIQLTFRHEPRQPGRFILGTDPNCCDIVLPRARGISAQHCAISFDAQARLVLDDFSEAGTQVWFGWECSGDRRDYSWVLSGGASSQRVVIDIQGVRFQVIVPEHDDWQAYTARVDAFCEQPPLDAFTAEWASVYSEPLIQHVFVKGHGGEPTGEVYLWDMSRPWEPMVRASA